MLLVEDFLSQNREQAAKEQIADSLEEKTKQQQQKDDLSKGT